MTANWIAGTSRWRSVGAAGAFVILILAAPTVCRAQPVNASAETIATTPAPQPDPLVAVCISERFVRLFSRPVSKLTPVDERILEVRFRGQAKTVGVVSLEFSPSENDAAVTITIGGTSLSTTTGRRNGAVIHGKATTEFSVTKTILLNMDRGFSTLPTRISASTDTKVEKVGAMAGGARGIVAKQIAASKSEQLKDQAEAEAQERAELRILSAVDEVIQTAVDKLNDGFFVIEPAIREYRRAANQVFHVRTSATHIQISARHADATGTPQLPAEAAEPHLVQVWLHGSLFNKEDREGLLREWPGIKQSLARIIVAALRDDPLAEADAGGKEVELPVEIQQVADWVRIAVDFDRGAILGLSRREPGMRPSVAAFER